MSHRDGRAGETQATHTVPSRRPTSRRSQVGVLGAPRSRGAASPAALCFSPDSVSEGEISKGGRDLSPAAPAAD